MVSNNEKDLLATENLSNSSKKKFLKFFKAQKYHPKLANTFQTFFYSNKTFSF